MLIKLTNDCLIIGILECQEGNVRCVEKTLFIHWSEAGHTFMFGFQNTMLDLFQICSAYLEHSLRNYHEKIFL